MRAGKTLPRGSKRSSIDLTAALGGAELFSVFHCIGVWTFTTKPDIIFPYCAAI
jgi:hypothetical protein